MSILKISAYGASNVGKRRQNNEDNYYLDGQYVDSLNDTSTQVSDQTEIIVSVCDGMGGEAAGEVASQIAVETVNKNYQNLLKENISDSAIEKCINEANALICDEIVKNKKRLGCTFTLFGCLNDLATISNIGDSRVYRFHQNCLEQISVDHTEAQRLVNAGVISAEDSMKIPEKHRLTQHLGIFPDEMILQPYTVRLTAFPEDKYLLCSDGLTDMLSDNEINAIISNGTSLKDTVNQLIEKALEKGGKDNVTVVLCEITDGELEPVNDNNTSQLKSALKDFFKIKL